MKFGRILANAFARRIAYVVIALVLAWLGLSDARAGDQSEELANCESNGSGWLAASPSSRRNPKCTLSGNQWTLTGETYQLGIGWQESTIAYYPFTNTCASKPSQVTQWLPLSGSKQCWNGCVVSYRQNGDDETSTRSHTGAVCSPDDFKENCGAGFFWNGHMGVCQPIEPDCPEGQKREQGICKPENQCPEGMVAVLAGTPGAIAQGVLHCKPSENECPAGNVRSPTGQCLPGEGQCAAGEARRPNGTCGKDSDGDGEADEDDDNPDNDPNKPTASGGDTCNQPPSCSGGPIDCMQVKIQWRIDCNTRKSRNISGGSCGAAPVCTGEKCDALEYSSLLMQWRTACAVEKLKPGTSEPGDGEKIKPDFEAFAGASDGANSDDSIFLPDGEGEGLNQSLISYGAGALGWNFSVEGQQFGMPQQISDFIAILKWLIIAAASIVGIAIAAGKL